MKRTNSKKMKAKSKGKSSGIVEKKTLRRWRKGTREKRKLAKKNMEEEDQKIGLNFSDSDDDQTPLSLLLKNIKGKEREVGDSSKVIEVFPKELQKLTGKDLDSDFKEVQVVEKEMVPDLGNAETKMEVVATIEVQNTMVSNKTIWGAEDFVLKEIDDAFKLNEMDLGEKGPKIKENNDTDKLSEICFGEGLQMDREDNDEDGPSGMKESMEEESEKTKKNLYLKRVKTMEKSSVETRGQRRYKYKVRRSERLTNKALSRFTNTEKDPICLDTDEKVKE
ncbi:hypothetical protein L1987_77870 [Smallanthus sonchifolius]|uniref:Uncharacterized protein n=1 Tax=Smallanthus sonchifolius TaxID=185202 RepID=A0ACB8ZBA9_9ASTR|nr:hypothetical protein L1987_77870 [Smallanthus sonchifolius]